MAKKKSVLDNDFSKLSAKSHSKLENENIKEERTTKQKNKAYNILIPVQIYEKLDSESKRLGMTKKALIMQALRKELDIS